MARSSSPHHKTLPVPRLSLAGLVQLLRPRQWVKNVFALAPLVFAGKFLDPSSVALALAACALFSLTASLVYIVNDIHDREHDRRHPVKSKKRPIAAGRVSVQQAMGLWLVVAVAVAVGLYELPRLAPVILGYLALNLAYTFVLKHQPVIDIFTIALGFVLRVYAGAVAIAVPVSSWMFVTTLCLALYLAAVKRRQELMQSGKEARKVLKSYSVSLADRYAEMSATGALVFYSLFVVTTRPELVWSIPFVLYGLFRYWYVVEIMEGGESPTDALLKDWQLMVVVLLWGAVSAWSIMRGPHS